MKRISPTALQALKEALVHIYWYKRDLRGFLQNAFSNPSLLNSVNWDDNKRSVVDALVSHLASHPEIYQNEVLDLMVEVSRIEDFSHLERIEVDGKEKAEKARSSVVALKNIVGTFGQSLDEKRAGEERKLERQTKTEKLTLVKEQREGLLKVYQQLVIEPDAQKRGYAMEKLMKQVFDLFDLDPRASFRIEGEQIDGSFSFDGTDYLLEAKWQTKPVAADKLDSFSSKIARRLDNTLGLMLSINGFSADGVTAHSRGKLRVILMDGQDLLVVLEGKMELTELLKKKKRHASETGDIYLRMNDIIYAQC